MDPSVFVESAEVEHFFEDFEPIKSWADMVEESDEDEMSDGPYIPSWANVTLDVTEKAKDPEPSPPVPEKLETGELNI